MIFKKLGEWIAIGFLMVLLTTDYGYPDPIQRDVTIAIYPCTDAVSSFKKFHPLIAYLSARTGFTFRLSHPKRACIYEKDIRNGKVDFVMQDPHVYLELNHLYDPSSVLQTLNQDGTLLQRAVVIVRKDSGLYSLGALKGKTVMFGPLSSTAKWVAAKFLFEEKGIHIDTDLWEYVNGGCCEDMAFNVYLKAVDAAVICEHFLRNERQNSLELGVDLTKLRVVDRTRPVPTKVFAAAKQTPPEIIDVVVQALISLDARDMTHRAILEAGELGGFKKTTPKDRIALRETVDALSTD
ncbi:MAG: phosphate/phosphite/phosphonate ABC transporter substrate-binding protein [Desulfatitalea sp.]|nr:phosphate/phosphite/phosphonate ABC transporter substrate-binding protein [Desulfatitalea sp.]NNK02004.1 phosphate/phosphite/phosphonate ABC transporter substrate-binding protein [Desulfatitalea sp.]